MKATTGSFFSGRLAVCLTAIVMLGATSAWAVPINYGNHAGSTVDFLNVTEDSGTDATPLYGSPTVTGDTLDFQTTAAFSSFSPNALGPGDTTDGRLSLVIQAKDGYFIDSITLGEFGDFSMVAVINAHAIATATGTLFGKDNVSNTESDITFTASRTNAPFTSAPFLLTGPGGDSGGWIATATLDYTGDGVTRVEIELDNTLQTSVDTGASSFIAKKGLDLAVQTSLIPEPGTLILAAGGMAMMLGARWRDRRHA